MGLGSCLQRKPSEVPPRASYSLQVRRVICFCSPSPPSPPVPATSSADCCSGADRTLSFLGLSRTRPRAPRCACSTSQRKAHGLQARCALDRKLNRAARGHARDMVAKRYFAHESPLRRDPSAPASPAPAGPAPAAPTPSARTSAGAAAGFATPRAMVNTWMNSAGHRANILYPQLPTMIGIGIANGSPDRRLRRDLRHRLRRLTPT